MTQQTAPPPHPQTKRFTRTQITIAIVGIALATVFAIMNYLKPAGNSGVQGTISVSNGSAGINNGTINNGTINSGPIGSQRAFEGGAGIPFENTPVRGILKPANEQTPKNACDGAAVGSGALKVLIGDNAVFNDGLGTFKIIGIRKCDALSIERKADGLFVNASLYDSEGGAVVLIRNNKITALNGETYLARQSEDESRLVVKNVRGAELFYLRYLNPTTIQFRGFLGCTGGPIVRIQEGQPIGTNMVQGNCGGNSPIGLQIGDP